MALRYLLDTNTLSEPPRPQPNQNVLAKLAQYRHHIALASVSWHELLYGFHRLPTSKRKKMIGDYLFQTILPNVPILPFDTKAAEWFGQERARLTQIGKPPVFADGQIAAIAIVYDLILVTRNEKDFVNFKGLRVENWF